MSLGSIGHEGKRLEQLIGRLYELPDPATRELAQDCLHSLLALYGEGLERILQLVANAGVDGEKVREALLRDRLVRGLLLIQQTGLLDSINAVRGNAVEYNLPVCMMVGLLEKEPGVPPRQSKKYGVRIVEPILEAMGIAYHEIEEQADVAKIRPAIDKAYEESKPVVLLIGRRPK